MVLGLVNCLELLARYHVPDQFWHAIFQEECSRSCQPLKVAFPLPVREGLRCQIGGKKIAWGAEVEKKGRKHSIPKVVMHPAGSQRDCPPKPS